MPRMTQADRARPAPAGTTSCPQCNFMHWPGGADPSSFAAFSAHDGAGLMALIEEAWCMLNGMMTGSDDLVNFDLSADEREFLREALSQWDGPAGCTEELAVAMGVDSVHDLLSETKRLVVAVSTGTPMSARDWART